jgi:L-asparaginase II
LLCAASAEGVGIAIKAEDGSRRAHRPALHAFLRPLGLELPDDFARVRLVNAHGETVGEAVCET